MRLSLRLDPDVVARLRDLASRRCTTFGAVLNDILRDGLNDVMQTDQSMNSFVVEPHAGGFRPGLDPAALKRLRDDIDFGESEAHGLRKR